jgi:uncharacterized membrane protein YhaH (DUF805 family)
VQNSEEEYGAVVVGRIRRREFVIVVVFFTRLMVLQVGSVVEIFIIARENVIIQTYCMVDEC